MCISGSLNEQHIHIHSYTNGVSLNLVRLLMLPVPLSVLLSPSPLGTKIKRLLFLLLRSTSSCSPPQLSR
jgi:hypothetical protein